MLQKTFLRELLEEKSSPLTFPEILELITFVYKVTAYIAGLGTNTVLKEQINYVSSDRAAFYIVIG